MKTTKLIIGIISIVLFVLIAFQSCAVGTVNILSESDEVSGTAGLLLAFCMLIAGIVGICTRKGRAGGIVAAVFYLFGGLMGISNYGTYSDLAIWSVLCFIFGIIFILTSLKKAKSDKSVEAGTKDTEEC
ncbi:MAG: hypothetical protein LUD14_04070 [Clostridiales bacterium]|nr:hypothetical protein [Clostridiales bacterium]